MSINFGQRHRRWRQKGKRGVSPIIATILLVAITVVLAAVLYILISGLTKGPGTTPLGTALALGSPTEAAVVGKFWYNFSIQSAGGGIVANNLQFQVLTSTGSIVPPASLTSVTLLNVVGTTVGTYSFASSSWTSGGTTPLNSQEQLSLLATINLSGDHMVVSGAGSFQGSINAPIP